MSLLALGYQISVPSIGAPSSFYFTSESGIRYEVRFGRKQDNVLHTLIVFGVLNDEFDGEEYAVTNRGELYRVMKTIVNIIKIYMERNPKTVCYEINGIAKEKEKNRRETIRVNLYKRYIRELFDKNWQITFENGSTIKASRSL